MKSRTFYQKWMDEHQTKLPNYMDNPEVYDNKGILKNVAPKLHNKIIDGRKNKISSKINRETNRKSKIIEKIKNRGVI